MNSNESDKYLRNTIYTVGGALVFLILALLLIRFRMIWGYLVDVIRTTLSLFKPLWIGLFMAFLLQPLVEFFSKKWESSNIHFLKKSRRALGTLFSYVTILALMGLLILVIRVHIAEVVGTGILSDFAENVSKYILYYQRLFNELTWNIEGFISFNLLGYILGLVNRSLESLFLSLANNILGMITTLGDHAMSIGLGLVIAFYLLKDQEVLMKIWKNIMMKLTTKKVGSELCSVGKCIHYVFSGYIRGQILDALIMTLLISTALVIIKLDFAIVVGVISGIFNVIPYFGPIVGFVLSGLIGFISGEPEKAFYAMGAVLILQQIDGWFIVPKIIGERVKLHPIVVLLSIIVGGKLGGFIGILLGVPISALLRCLIVRYVGDIFSAEYKTKSES